MIEIPFALTYLGVVCCYAASPKADERVWGVATLKRRPWMGRLAGGGLMGGALVLLVLGLSPAVGILVGLSAAILSASCVVIAAPLAPRLIPVTLVGVLLAVLFAQLG